MTQSSPVPGDTRSASEVVGIALLLGIVFLGVSVILVTGLSELGDSQEGIETAQAEQALTEFDSDAARVATDSTSSQRINLGLEGNSGTLDVEEGSGSITVIYNDEFLGDEPQLNVTRPLGTLVYENGDTTVGYQGGGVWRGDGPNSTMVSPPEITYEGNTLTLPIIETKDGGSVHSDVQITSNGPSEQLFPDAKEENLNLTNKVNTGTFRIIIESRYYEAWGQYFKEETDATVLIGAPEEGKVTIVFFGSAFSINEDAGIIATSGPGEVFMTGTPGSQDKEPTYLDSYDSSVGPYSETNDTTGLLKSAGNITMSGNAEIRGDAESEDRISIENDVPKITRDAHANEGVYIQDEEVEPGTADEEEQIGGNVTNDANVPTLVPLPVGERVDEIKENNDNDEFDPPGTGDIKDGELQFNNSNALTLESGTYYLDEMDLGDEDNEKLFLDARDGPITIGVNNYVRLQKNSNSKIKVKGDRNDSAVQIYVASRDGTPKNTQVTNRPADHFYVGPKNNITVNQDASYRFQVIGPADFTGGVEGDSSVNTEMTGVIFAPLLNATGEGEFAIKDAEFFGAIVTGNLTIDNKAKVHFDRGILGLGVPLPEGALLDYLHITRHEVEVKGSRSDPGS